MNQPKKVLTLLALILLLFVSGFSEASSAHWSGSGAVDSREIRWGTYGGSTAYTTARNHSIAIWDNLGLINIAGDTSSTVEDLSFRDIYVTTTLLGRYTILPGADSIEYNIYNFEEMSDGEQKKTALHEMGHALSFEHHTSGIMKQGWFSMTYLDAHIKEDYYSRW